MELSNETKKKYGQFGVDVDAVIKRLENIAVSVHCWQGDDVGGFEHEDGGKLEGGGIQVTGNYPGKARNMAELRADLEKVLSLVPGKKRVNLHASYGEFGGKFEDRDKIRPEHFDGWIAWAKKHGVGLDFNGTFFSHPMADGGYTISSKDPKVRKFWIDHAKAVREIAAHIGKEMGEPCVLNTWVPDGAKDFTVDKFGYRKILKESLDEIFAVKYPKEYLLDAVETKLWGIGVESFTVGSHEFYMNYAARNGLMICIDMGHFHPTEDISDKLSSVLLFDDEMLMHISRPVRWDSDHVVVFNDDVKHVAEELVRSGKLENVHLGLDYFDASINRIGAWSIGARAFQKALLFALLEPTDTLRKYEEEGNGFAKLALLEAQHTLPFGEVWDYYCAKNGVIDDTALIADVMKYEKEVLDERN